jgi:hypothetical protein
MDVKQYEIKDYTYNPSAFKQRFSNHPHIYTYEEQTMSHFINITGLKEIIEDQEISSNHKVYGIETIVSKIVEIEKEEDEQKNITTNFVSFGAGIIVGGLFAIAIMMANTK